jgi:hypothetical protein
VAGLILATPALAESETVGSGLVVHEDDGVSYVSGGIGSAQQEALQRVAGRFNLKLTMATKDGKYIGRADIRIADEQGRTVIEAPSDGPLFFAKIPTGKYDVRATADGTSLTEQVTVAAQGQKQIVLTWPQTAD